MSKKILILIVFLLSCFFVKGQSEKESSTSVSKKIPDLEKAYIHTDRDYYTFGENIWYKAYLVYAYTNTFFNNSNTLYVELISPDSKIVSRNITRVQDGIGNGDFMLADSLNLKAGTYQIRAYTNWMRNFDKGFIFKKEIEVLDLTENTVSVENSYEKKKKNVKKRKTKKQKIDFQFFPEGGSLIDNVSSIIAFKCTDQYGMPIDFNGEVFNEKGKSISLIKSQHDGMGKFSIIPELGEKYFAEIKYKGNVEQIDLPQIKQNGFVLNVVNKLDQYYLKIKTNEETYNKLSDKSISIIASTRGVSYFDGVVNLGGKETLIKLPVDKIPEGICRITLVDSMGNPQCERLVFINKEKKIDVKFELDKKSYKTKEKTNVIVSAKMEDNTPVDGSFSIAFTDGKMGLKNVNNSSISSYFLMEADIKGKVYNPGYYFNPANKNRFYYLDLLLLTQGWRDFIWRKIPEEKEKPQYPVEKGIDIEGTVSSMVIAKAREGRLVSLLLSNEKGEPMAFTDTTDVNGRYSFKNLFFRGKTKMALNTKDRKNRNKGMILLDPIYSSPLSTTFSIDEAFFDKDKKSDSIINKMYQNRISFNVPVENMLDDIVIKSKLKKDDIGGDYGEADETYVIDEDYANFRDVAQLIQFTVRNVSLSGGGVVSFSRNSGQPVLIIVDGIQIDQSQLDLFSPDDIAKIESFRGPSTMTFGMDAGGGVIVLYTKEGKFNTKKSKYTIVENIEGYQKTRVFYSPNYDKLEDLEKSSRDIRNTIFWKPYVHPNKEGISTFSFFNSAVKTRVNIVLEGLTASGVPLVVKDSYEVK